MTGDIMNKQNKARLIGMVLGDGCLKVKQRGYVELAIEHTPRQKEYLEYKRDLLHSIFGGKIPAIRTEKHTLSNDKTYTGYRFSKQHKYFKQLRRLIYSNDSKKFYTEKLLQYLNPEALSMWYMDDGGLVVNLNNEGNVSSFEVRLYTYCSLEEALTIQKYFYDTYAITVKIPKYNKSGSYNIRMNTTEGRKFLALTEQFIVPCMKYKWDISSRTRARNISIYDGDDDIV